MINKILGALGIITITIMGIWLYFSIVAIPLQYLKKFLYFYIDDTTYYFIGEFLVTVLIAFFVLLSKVIPDIKKGIQKCPHGIRGGTMGNTCPQCVYEKTEKLHKEQEEIRLEDIRRKAIEFKKNEIEKLKVKQYRKLDFLYALSPLAFEDAIIEMFRNLGYKVNQTPYSNDRGKDGIAYKNNKKYLIECKRYEKNTKIGRPHLQKFFAAIYEEKAVKGFFVTTSIFADTAYEYAEANNIELINGSKLIELMQQAYPEQNDDMVEVMCLQCGETVRFDLVFDESKKYCRNRHPVENNISYSDLQKLSNIPKSSYRRRKQKRYK